jgi:hypothetical protein
MSVAATKQALAKRSSERIAGLSPQKFFSLRALGQDSRLGLRVRLDTVYRETMRTLERLSREVREGKNVLEASTFVRWLNFSGVLELLQLLRQDGQDFTALPKKVGELIQECGEQFRGGRVTPKYAESDIAEINRKLDVLLSSNARPLDISISVGSPKCNAPSGNGRDGPMFSLHDRPLSSLLEANGRPA